MFSDEFARKLQACDREKVLAYIAALRSGKYRQTEGIPHEIIDGQECFCAIGVPVQLFDPDSWNRDPRRGSLGLVDENFSHLLGGERDPDIRLAKEIFYVNDGLGRFWLAGFPIFAPATFAEIADGLAEALERRL